MTELPRPIRTLVVVEVDPTTGAITTMHEQLPVLQSHSLAAGAPPAIELAVAAWLDAKRNRSKSAKTERAYTDTIAGFRAALQATGLDLDGDPRAIALAAQRWAGRNEPKPTTYNQRLAVLSSFYGFARRQGLYAGDNPIARVERRPVQDYASAQPLNVDDVRRRLRAIDRTDLSGLRDYTLLAIFIQTGRRLAEVAGLRWADVQLTDERVTLHFRRAKGGKVMVDLLPLPVGQTLLMWLHRVYGADIGALAPEAPLWVSLSRNSRGRALSVRSVATICADRLGVSKVHALRHTFARTMEDAGAKVSEIQERLGHSSLATTGRYLAALRRAENAHADELARRFGLDE